MDADEDIKVVAYRITNLVNGREYLGITRQDADRRWASHVRHARAGSTFPIHQAIRKYGPAAFAVHTIACARGRYNAWGLERLLIAQERTHVGCGGYNVTLGGQGNFGTQFSPEHRAKIAAALRGDRKSVV